MVGLLESRRIARQAGASAARSYLASKRAWQARQRTVFLALGCGTAVLVVLSLVLAGQQIGGWVSGLVCGLAIASFVFLRQVPPVPLESYLAEAAAEARTTNLIGWLVEWGWVVVHDVKVGGRMHADRVLDHVLIGPGGAFVLDTKSVDGTIQVHGELLGVVRAGQDQLAYSDDRPGIRTRAQAVELNRLVHERCGLTLWVTSLLVVWADFPQRRVEGYNMAYVHGDELVDWLLEQPVRLTPRQIDQIATALRANERVADGVLTPVESAV